MRALLLLLLAAPAALPLQQDRPSDTMRRDDVDSPSRMDVDARTDALLASWLLVDSNNEIELAQIASERAQDPQVKQFAQRMITEHRAMSQKLQPFATGSRTAMKPDESRSRTTAEPGNDEESGGRRRHDPSRAAGFAHGGSFDHIGLIEELGRQCLATARTELESKSGSVFDRCYMGMMVGAHAKTNDTLTVFQRHASGDLKSVMANGQRNVQAHLAQAKDLKQELEYEGTETSGTR